LRNSRKKERDTLDMVEREINERERSIRKGRAKNKRWYKCNMKV
jgi:hypothetical protein